MSKWIIKKTINETLKKNLVLEETDSLFTEAISLGKYSGGFDFFSSGKKFKLSEDEVVKISGKREDYDQHLIPYDIQKNNKSYCWVGPSIKNHN